MNPAVECPLFGFAPFPWNVQISGLRISACLDMRGHTVLSLENYYRVVVGTKLSIVVGWLMDYPINVFGVSNSFPTISLTKANEHGIVWRNITINVEIM